MPFDAGRPPQRDPARLARNDAIVREADRGAGKKWRQAVLPVLPSRPGLAATVVGPVAIFSSVLTSWV